MYEIFEKLLKSRGITAYKVAKDTGITTATLTSWKQGKYVPKQDKLQKIADYFNVSVDYLINGKDGEKEDNNNDYAAKDKMEREMLVLCRSMEDVSEEEKEALINNFKNSIDIFLKAKGLK
ncbi:helix-turn-helix domain-containing protein [Anaerosporobacter faecicola]|uniref:helix-turn-helix domain-containing protein n=1 Tax=Anaerosporobacter faecicola TaxID=2718714 RepID=UPI00143BE945|nr:helix-turn-helix transcriptional regulator [Anaerosporobacter faecicola]